MGVGHGGWCLGVQSARDWWSCEMGRSKSGVGDGGFLCAKWYQFLFFPVCHLSHFVLSPCEVTVMSLRCLSSLLWSCR